MKSSSRYICELILSLPKTAYFNFRYLPLHEAIHLPIFVHRRTKICEMYRGGVELEDTKTGIIRIGFPSGSFDARKTMFCVSGKILFKGSAAIGNGCELVIRGLLTVGNHLTVSDETKIDAKSESVIGNNVLIGHKCTLIDDDGHKILSNGSCTNSKRGYHIGNHVWLSRECLVLKGSYIADNVVVGARSLIAGKYESKNVVLAGAPAKIVKENIDWDY